MKKIKLKRLHPKDTHAGRDIEITYSHDSSRSVYGYKDYRIKYDYAWYVEKDGERLTRKWLMFSEAREWLENHLYL